MMGPTPPKTSQMLLMLQGVYALGGMHAANPFILGIPNNLCDKALRVGHKAIANLLSK